MSKKTEIQKIEIKLTDYEIFFSIKDKKIHLEIYPSKNKEIYYYKDYSLKQLKNNNNVLKNYNNIQEIYDFLKNIKRKYHSKYNTVKINENEKFVNLIIMIGQENITFPINLVDDKPENEDNSIFENNLNNFENILNDIENDMFNFVPYVKELENENKKIIEENINLKKQIKDLSEENQMLKEKLKNININNKNSEDNLIISESKNNNKENLKQEKKIQVIKKINQENNINSNSNIQKFGSENKGTKDENSKSKNLNRVNSLNKKSKDNIFSNELKDKIIVYIKQSKNYKYKNISFQLLYKATKDNDSASSFHEKVDDKGPIIVIIKTSQNRIIGGFSSKSWSSKNTYMIDEEAFLFSDFNKFNITSKEKGNACFHNQNEGPHFGKNALIISNNCLTNDNNICGNDTFSFKNNNNLLGKKTQTKLIIEDYEVYHVIIKL